MTRPRQDPSLSGTSHSLTLVNLRLKSRGRLKASLEGIECTTQVGSRWNRREAVNATCTAQLGCDEKIGSPLSVETDRSVGLLPRKRSTPGNLTNKVSELLRVQSVLQPSDFRQGCERFVGKVLRVERREVRSLLNLP